MSLLFYLSASSHPMHPSPSPRLCQPPSPPPLSYVHFPLVKMSCCELRSTSHLSCIACILCQPCASHCHLCRIGPTYICQLASTHHLKTLIHRVLGLSHAHSILFVSLKPFHASQPPPSPCQPPAPPPLHTKVLSA